MRPMEEVAMPLPTPLITPPITKMYLCFFFLEGVPPESFLSDRVIAISRGVYRTYGKVASRGKLDRKVAPDRKEGRHGGNKKPRAQEHAGYIEEVHGVVGKHPCIRDLPGKGRKRAKVGAKPVGYGE